MNKAWQTQIPPRVLVALSELELGLKQKCFNPQIAEVLEASVLHGGKRLRPLLTFIFSQFMGGKLEKTAPFAACIEFVHAASLAHDDVIDQAHKRRGVDSINILAGNKKAVLAGDYLLANVIGELCRQGRFELVSEMSLVIQDLSEGEWLQTESAKPENCTRDYVHQVAMKKTASVLSWCCLAPAYLAGMPQNIVEYAREFGQHLGLAFQMVDDILDYQFGLDRDSEKDGLQDLQNGLVNSVSIELFNLLPEFKQQFLERGWDSHSALPWKLEEIEIACQRVKQRAQQSVDRAKELLEVISQERPDESHKDILEAKQSLVFLVDFLITRKF